MKTLFTSIAFPGLLFIKISLAPDLNLLAWVFAAIGFDFVTGFAKAVILKEARTSEACRRTFPKFVQYAGAIVLTLLIGNAMPSQQQIMARVADFVFLLIIYIECMSVCENFIAMLPESKMSKYFFSPVLNILTLSFKNLIKQFPPQKDGLLTIAGISMLAITLLGCKVVRPGVNTVHTKTDTTFVTYKKVDVEVKGGEVTGTLNADSLLRAFNKRMYEAMAASSAPNFDSLYTSLKATLKPLRDTVKIIDNNSKVELKYWLDEFGKLQISCGSKDQTIQFLVAEINKLTKEYKEAAKTEVVYRMPWWGWIVVGAAICAILAFVLLLLIANVRR